MRKINQITFDEIIEHNKIILPDNYSFPKTRYQGSKAKILDWIWENISSLKFESVLDAFGGTGCVSYKFKQKGKRVIYNDILKFNCTIAKALIENMDTLLEDNDIEYILTKQDKKYPTYIQDNFQNIFYLDSENKWLDYVITNIKDIENEKKQAIAWFALFQACIIKRPYNLFHRANLYVRTKEVERSFGNKTTWDTPFEKHFRNFVDEANNAIFSLNKKCEVVCGDIFEFPIEKYKPDLVYIDSPYISSKGVGTDYLDFYHFLEGMIDYDNWQEKILLQYKHKPLKGKGESVWINKRKIYDAFDKLFSLFKDSILVVSYREDGIPSHTEIIKLLEKYKKNVIEVHSKDYQYALSIKKSKEILFIAK